MTELTKDQQTEFEAAAFEHAVQPRLRDIEDATQVPDIDERRRAHAAVGRNLS